jgi:predicted MFS family arabinose efflux permease
MTAVLLVVLPLPQSWVLLALLSVILLGGPLTAYTIPAMSVITDSAERLGIALAVATMMLNLAWATGETIGAPAAANLSQATSDAVPLLLLALIMVGTLWPVVRARLGKLSPLPQTAPGQAEAGPDPEPQRAPVSSG